MLRKSHKEGIAPHRDTWGPNNILMRDQIIDAVMNENQAVWMTHQPGEASFHHVDMWHASKPNNLYPLIS